jgi:hypothetical protein
MAGRQRRAQKLAPAFLMLASAIACGGVADNGHMGDGPDDPQTSAGNGAMGGMGANPPYPTAGVGANPPYPATGGYDPGTGGGFGDVAGGTYMPGTAGGVEPGTGGNYNPPALCPDKAPVQGDDCQGQPRCEYSTPSCQVTAMCASVGPGLLWAVIEHDCAIVEGGAPNSGGGAPPEIIAGAAPTDGGDGAL